jgi:hypothetical protein
MYDVVFRHAHNELAAAGRSWEHIKHLLVVLGAPIAIPRLTVLEKVLRSVLIAPLSYLNESFGALSYFLNQYDSKVWLLPSLDNYTAHAHKKERKDIVNRLQDLAIEHSARILILSGGMRVAAVGCFYARRDLHVAAKHDYRYMANIVSSPMVNKPLSPKAATFVVQQNKQHYFDADTDETLLKMFVKDNMINDGDRDCDHEKKATPTGHIMPCRNFVKLAENFSRKNNSSSSSKNQTTTSLIMPPLVEGVTGFSKQTLCTKGSGERVKSVIMGRSGASMGNNLEMTGAWISTSVWRKTGRTATATPHAIKLMYQA